MNRKILLISYYFPPLGGAGISRPLSLFQHLPNFGYDCHVLTVKPVLYRVYEPELMDGLDQSKIIRSGSRDPSRLLYLLGLRKISASTADKSQAISKHFFPDAKAGWISPAVRLAQSLCRKSEYDLIFSTSPSMSAHVIAKKISQEFNIPWGADFQDYWTLEKAERHFESKENQRKAVELLSQVKSCAKSVIANNESVAKYVGADTIISNSFQSELAKLWQPPSTRERIAIGVFGTLGELNPIEPLLQALTMLKQKRPDLYDKTKILQIGQVNSDWLMGQLSKHGHRDIFEIGGYQPRKTAIQLLSNSALFYFGLSPEIGQGVTPIRLYTLLASGRPILAFAPAGSGVAKIIRTTNNGLNFDHNNIDKAVDFIIEQSERFLAGGSDFRPIPEYAREFSSDKMVEKFARVFNKLVGS